MSNADDLTRINPDESNQQVWGSTVFSVCVGMNRGYGMKNLYSATKCECSTLELRTFRLSL